MKEKNWARVLAYVKGLVNQELLLQNELWVIKTRLISRINSIRPGLRSASSAPASTMRVMIALALAVLAYCRAFFIGRHRLGLEVAALRQQLVVLKRKQPRPRLYDVDRAFGSPSAVCGRGGRTR